FHVTGVQTCALPISGATAPATPASPPLNPDVNPSPPRCPSSPSWALNGRDALWAACCSPEEKPAPACAAAASNLGRASRTVRPPSPTHFWPACAPPSPSRFTLAVLVGSNAWETLSVIVCTGRVNPDTNDDPALPPEAAATFCAS